MLPVYAVTLQYGTNNVGQQNREKVVWVQKRAQAHSEKGRRFETILNHRIGSRNSEHHSMASARMHTSDQ